MPTTTFMESGTDATGGFEFFAGTSGTVASDTVNFVTGSRSIKCTSGAAGAVSRVSTIDSLIFLGGGGTGKGRVSFSVRIGSYPTSGTLRIFQAAIVSFNNSAVNLSITTAGVLQLFDSAGTQIGSNGATLATGTWYRITFTVTNDSLPKLSVFVDAALSIGPTTVTGTVGQDTCFFGWLTASVGNSLIVNIDNIYIDDSSAGTDIGNVQVAALAPVATNTNNFDTTIGSGANRWDFVDEVPLSTTNGLQHAATSDVQENFGLPTQSAAGLTGATLIARQAWVWAKRTIPPIGLVQEGWVTSSKSAGTTLALSPSGLTANNTILIAFSMDSATGTVSCTDNATIPNAYTVDVDVNGGGTGTTCRTCIIRANLVTITSLTTITITHPSVTARAAVASEFSGIDLLTPLDKSAGVAGSSTAASSGATAATTVADEVIWGAIGREDDITGTPFGTIGTGMTPDQIVILSQGTTGGGAASNMSVLSMYAIQTATNAQTADSTVTNGDWTACVACYKCSPAGGSGVGTPKLMDNGSESAVTLATTAALYSLITDSASWPSNAAGIGMRSSAASPDTFLYECGTQIAYIPAVGAAKIPYDVAHSPQHQATMAT
jgi:hypothetical protein